MKKKNIIISFIIIIITLGISSISYAGDDLYHFMQAHQDYLIIGEIEEVKKGDTCKIKVSELIETSSIRKDIPNSIDVKFENVSSEETLQKGDCVALSLSKRGGGYKIENGWYKITTDDTDTLEIIKNNNLNNDNELAAVELFLKSRGKIKDFYFVENGAYISKEAGVIENTDVCIYSEETGKVLPVDYEKNEKYIVTKEKNNFKIIMCLILIFVVAQVITLFVYIKLNPNCKLLSILKFKENKKE